MSIKSKVLAAAATLTIVGGLSTAGTLSASAATLQCSAVNKTCLEVYSLKYATPTSLGFVETVFLGIPAVGVPTIVHQASSSDPAEDLIIPLAGTVSQLYALGMVSAAVNEHYGSERAAQIEYAPYGVPPGLCTAVATPPSPTQPPTPQPCTTPATTAY